MTIWRDAHEQQPCLTHRLWIESKNGDYRREFRPCMRREQHEPDCVDDKCKGCMPRTAKVGYLCEVCAERAAEALPAWHTLEQALQGVDRAVTPEVRTQSKPGSRLPIPPIPLDFEEIRSYLSSYTGTVERWAADEDGAADALRFTRAVRSAVAAHPTIEHPSGLKRTRCPDCHQLTLTWYPPVMFGSDRKVKCRDPLCGREVRKEAVDDVAHIEALTR